MVNIIKKAIGLSLFAIVVYAISLATVNIMYSYWSKKTDERCLEDIEQICHNVCKEACNGK